MKKFFMVVLASMFPCGVAIAADGGLDAGADTDTDTDSDADADAGCTSGEAECSGDPSTWMWCNEANEWVETGCLEEDLSEGDFVYSTCNCDSADPCGWILDNYCDEECLSIPGVDEMFDDSVDCTPYDGGSDSDSDGDIDADSDADTDTGDASPSGDTSEGCGCRATGARLERPFLSLVL